MKKSRRFLSLVLAVIMMFSMFTVAVSAQSVELAEAKTYDPYEATWMLVGSEELTGYDWESDPEKAPENVMAMSYGLYYADFSTVKPYETYEFMVVANYPDGTQEWFGDENGEPIAVYANSYTYNPTLGEVVARFAIEFNPTWETITVTNYGSCEEIDWDTIDKVYGLRQTDSSLNSVTVDWADIKGAQKYWVYVEGELVASTTESSYTVKSEPNCELEVYVTALLEDSRMLKAENADVIAAYTEGTYYSYSSDTDSFEITWEAVGVTKTWIYYGEDEESLKLYASTTDSTYTISNLNSNTTYYYKLVHLVDGVLITGTDGYFETDGLDELVTDVYNADGDYYVSWSEYDGTYKYWVIVEMADKTYTYATTDTSYTVTGLDYADCVITVKGYNGEKMIEYYSSEFIAI